jgi:hypothetical protein
MLQGVSCYFVVFMYLGIVFRPGKKAIHEIHETRTKKCGDLAAAALLPTDAFSEGELFVRCWATR